MTVTDLLEGSNLQSDVAAQVLSVERELLLKRLEAGQVGLECIRTLRQPDQFERPSGRS